jgi:hypothetical protein
MQIRLRFLGFVVVVEGLSSSKSGRVRDGAVPRWGRGVPCTCRENFTVRVLDDASSGGASRCVGEFGAEEAGDSLLSGEPPSDCWKTRWRVSHVAGVPRAVNVTGCWAATFA